MYTTDPNNYKAMISTMEKKYFETDYQGDPFQKGDIKLKPGE